MGSGTTVSAWRDQAKFDARIVFTCQRRKHISGKKVRYTDKQECNSYVLWGFQRVCDQIKLEREEGTLL